MQHRAGSIRGQNYNKRKIKKKKKFFLRKDHEGNQGVNNHDC